MKLSIDRAYYKNLLNMAVPIAIQNGINALLNMADVLMIGQLGATSVASAALANQIAFLLTFFMFGITSGAAAFSAQYWGKSDVVSIRKVLGICMASCLSVAVFFTLVAEFIPMTALRLYTQDPAVIELGALYLQIAGASYMFSAISLSYSSVLKGMGLVRLTMAVSVTALSLKAFLSYALIFGLFGLPSMGVLGGAAGTLAARIVEFVLMLAAVYLRRTPLACRLNELLGFSKTFAFSYFKVAFPVVLNEILWSMGISTYYAIYARVGTEAVAAINIAASIEGLAFVLVIACSDAGGILTGNQIGAGNDQEAYHYARRSLINSTVLGLLIGGVVMLFSEYYTTLFQVEPQVRQYARNILIIMGILFFVRASNFTLIVSIMRAGGDTRFSAVIDTGAIWLVGIPMALLGAYLFNLPIWGIYLMVMADEVARYILSFRRFLSRRWIHNLAQIEG